MDTMKIPANMNRLLKLLQGKKCSVWPTDVGIRERDIQREPQEWHITADEDREKLETLRKDPRSMIKEICYIAESGFDPTSELIQTVKENALLVEPLDKDFMTEQFQKILVSPHAGKGIELIRQGGLLPYFVGKNIYLTMSKNEKKALDFFIRNIDKTLPILERRVTVFYMGFFKKRDYTAMEHLHHGDGLREREAYAHKHLPDLYLIKKKSRLKGFIYEQGYENYQFLDGIAKIQCNIYELNRTSILMRHNMLEEVKVKNEAVFIEDLAINVTDILEAGITGTEDQAEKILSLLPCYVHKHPKFNTKEILLDQAKKLRIK